MTRLQNRTILIVGGAGYIGSYVNKRLSQCGYQTIVFDNLSRGSLQNVSYGTLIQGDLENTTDLKNLFQSYSFDAIMHFAAHTDVGESCKNPLMYYENNVKNSLHLLHFALEHHINLFVFSSSASIFGMPLKELIDEDHPKNPVNPYGRTKWMVETILEDFDHAYGLKSCSLRYFNAAGADPEGEIKWPQRHESNVIPLLLKSLEASDRNFTLFGTDYPTFDGTCIRDYIHLHDIAEAHIKGLERLFDKNRSCAYNLGNGRGFSVRDVIKAVEKVSGKTLAVIEGPRRPGDPPILVANSHKALRELGWKPQFPELETMIEHAYKAMKGN